MLSKMTLDIDSYWHIVIRLKHNITLVIYVVPQISQQSPPSVTQQYSAHWYIYIYVDPQISQQSPPAVTQQCSAHWYIYM